MDLNTLKKEIHYQWRVQSFSKNKASASCVAYIDARDVMNLLDEVCGPENWQSDFKDVGSKLYAGIGILVEHANIGGPDHITWVWKWDTGTETDVEAEKGQASDAFKRAAVKWGIGRFLYDLDVKYVETDGPKTEQHKYPSVIDGNGKKVYDLTKFINEGTKPALEQPGKPAPTIQLSDKKRIAALLQKLGHEPEEIKKSAAFLVKQETELALTPDNVRKIINLLTTKVEQEQQ